MRLFCLENLVSLSAEVLTVEEVSVFKNPRPAGLSKEAFRQWCVESSTKGLFVSVFSGADESLRVSSSNPVFKMHGIICDYDSSSAWEKLSELPKTVTNLPQWVTKTFSDGKARALWPFEIPIIVNNPDLLKRFIKKLDKFVGFSKGLPGFDSASFDPSQYFEVGSEWTEVEDAKPLSSGLLELAMIEAADRVVIPTTDLAIPLPAVAEAVAERFPGRWSKPFEVGQRGPLFWINDGIDREGCVVSESGMVCYSDRAGSNFLSWREILGSNFVQQYEEQIIGQAALTFWFDGRSYYRKIGDRWLTVGREDARLQLKSMGVSDKARKGQPLTDVEKVLNHIQLQRRVAGAAPLAYRKEDIVMVGGKPILNVGCIRAMEPADEGDPSKFPWIWEFINNAFDEGISDESARDHFLGWFYWFYKTALECNLQPGHILIIAGAAHSGKSFLSKWIIGEALGGSFDATEVLIKQNAFNKSAAEYGLWRIDDAIGAGSAGEKRALTQALKRHAANPTILYQPKFQDAQEIPFDGRAVMTLNDDAESVSILPNMDNSFGDKAFLMLMNPNYKPKFSSIKSENEQRVMRELPFFLRWLLDTWGANGLPESIRDEDKPRFGVKPYHHPALVEKSHAETPEYALQELLDIWVTARSKDSENKKTQYTASELMQEIRTCIPEASRDINSRGFGRMLTKLVGVYPKLVDKTVSKGISRYRFDFFGEVAPF